MTVSGGSRQGGVEGGEVLAVGGVPLLDGVEVFSDEVWQSREPPDSHGSNTRLPVQPGWHPRALRGGSARALLLLHPRQREGLRVFSL